MEDQSIIRLFWNRDEQAIEESKKKYGSYCHTVAYRILENCEDAEECVSDTWLKAWNSIPPHQPKSLSAYLGKITRNLAYDRYRYYRQKKRGQGEAAIAFDELEAVLASDGNPEEEYDRKALANMIQRFLATLSERDRNILLCRYFYVYPIKDIAQSNNKSPKYIQLILTRTLKKLKKFLEKENYL